MECIWEANSVLLVSIYRLSIKRYKCVCVLPVHLSLLVDHAMGLLSGDPAMEPQLGHVDDCTNHTKKLVTIHNSIELGYMDDYRKW